MEKTERDQRLAEVTAAQEARIEGHVRALESLEATTSFDLDIASTIHPEIIDVRNERGRNIAAMYQELHSAADLDATYVTLLRYQMGLEPGCYGFGKDAKYEVKDVWVRVFKDLPGDAITYTQADNGAEVTINHPSVVFTRTKQGRGITMAQEESAVLFNQEPLRLFTEGIQEQHLIPSVRADEKPESAYRLLFDTHEFQYQTPGLTRGLVNTIRDWAQVEKALTE